MKDKNFNFSQTKDALSQLSADMAEFETTVKAKQTDLISRQQKILENLSTKEQKIVALQQAVDNALQKTENICRYIEKVL